MTEQQHIDIVAGLEMYANRRDYTFDVAPHDDGFEVLLLRNDRPRRMALCSNKIDAETIVEALRYAKEMGGI